MSAIRCTVMSCHDWCTKRTHRATAERVLARQGVRRNRPAHRPGDPVPQDMRDRAGRADRTRQAARDGPGRAAARPAHVPKGAGGAKCKLSAAQLRELATLLDAGPATWGWDEDQCWTLARIAEVVRRRFGAEYTLAGMDVLLHRSAGVSRSRRGGPPSATRRRSPPGGRRPGPWEKDRGGPGAGAAPPRW
jgi:hypothetical protein